MTSEDLEGELPSDVRRLSDAVSEKLGRPAHCRKVKNQSEWYVHDPVFSFVQQGMKKGNTGYRIGYQYRGNDRSLWFIIVHSPIMASLFKRNIAMSTFTEVLRATSEFRSYHYVLWNSKLAVQLGYKKGILRSITNSFDEFIEQLMPSDDGFDFVGDLFPKMPNTGKGKGKAPVAGNTFYLALSDKSKCFESMESVRNLVELTWPLFLCLYPVKAIEKRTAALARKMLARKIPKTCEYSFISVPNDSGISPLCRGSVQGAHIKPDKLGGSDSPENGLWLCEYHHRSTEGKLSGDRIDGLIKVCYAKKS